MLWLPQWLSSKESTCIAGDIRDVGSIPGSGRSAGGHGNPLQYSRLENPMDRGAWRATVHRSQRIGHDSTPAHHSIQIICLFIQQTLDEGLLCTTRWTESLRYKRESSCWN